MEFIMTYGWAIVVVLIVITALSHFGILNPGSIFSERCILELGLECVDHKVGPSEVSLIIKNILGTTITIKGIEVLVNEAVTCSGVDSQIMPNNARSVFIITGCSNGILGERFKGEITISYTKKGLSHIAKGTIIAEITPGMMPAETAESADICKNAADGDLCDGLDIVFGEGYQETCCSDHNLCC